MAGDQKKVRDRDATLIFTDESGFLLAPLVRRTLARRGHTPELRHRARHRDKVSAAAALTLSPRRGHAGLYYQTYPDAHVDVDAYAAFLHALLAHIRHPLVLVQDRGNMHKGPPMRDLLDGAFARRLDVNLLPPYAPELNPVEYLWTHVKHERLANFAALDVPQLDGRVCACLDEARHDQDRLHSFFAASPLPWNGLTGLM
jgi:transposase